jgi:filamentous hemagglutinin family protein
MKSASLNHIYRLVWNEATNTYVAVAEHIAGRGKRTSGVAGVLVAASLVLLAGGAARAQALPTGAAIAAGAATISQSGGQMTITQATQRLVTNWNSFDVGAGASVRFAQPNAGAIALNRVTGGGAASAIDGSLSANGNVWLLNPNGVVFGSGAQVNVGGLVASSLGMSDSDFLAGRTRLTGGAGAGAVVNHGTIRTASGGVVALVAPRVVNTGSIATPGGSTALAAGETVSLDFQGDGLVSVRVERGVADAAVENSGRITAEGGLVTLSARGADAVLGSVVNNTGVIEAHGLVARDGRILLDGDTANGGTTHVAGTLDVTSAGGRGGAIVVTGKSIALDGGASLDASGATGGGTVNVGGGWQGKDAAIANATTVTADASVTLRADATGSGDGGKVVAWSDGTTTFAGRTSARGGAQGGDGGDIEVSGKGELHYSGRADALAPNGRTGNLLLDPATLDIQGGGTGTGATTGSVVYERDLEAQNANVLLQATGEVNVRDLTLNGGDGRISMANNVSLRIEGGTTGSGSITFANAANTLEVFGTGSLMLVAGQTGTGYINNVPNMIAHGAGVNPSTLPSHNVSSVGSGTPGAGTLTIFGADGVTVGGSLATNGGYVRVWADSDNQGGGGYTMSAPVTTNGGNFYVSAGTGAINLNSNMTLGTGRIVFRADGSYTSGTRTLGGVISANGPVTVDSPFVMNAGSGIYTDGAITFTSSVNLNTGAGALTLRASDIDFSNATVTNVSTASIVLQPYDVTTNINLNGAATGIARATTFAKLAGIKNLTIGRADGTGVTTVPTSGFGFSASDTLKLLNGSIAIDGALTNTNASGRIVAQATQGDVTLGAAGSVTASGTGDAVVLAAGRNFVDNNPSASAISAANGRWLVYSTTPDNDTRGSLVNGFKQYNINYGGTAATDTVLGTGNGFLYRVAPVVGVALTGTVRKVYDGTNAATVTTANLANTGGAIDGDAVTFAVGPNGSAIYDTKNAGTTKQVNVSGIAIDSATNAGVRVYGYQFSPTASATVGEVDKRVLATTSNGGIGVQAAVAGKTYDGNTTAAVTGITLANKIAGDDLTATASAATFDTKNAGTGKTVTVSGIQYAGVDAGNYDLTTTTTTTTAAITPKTVTATASVADKVYDGGTSATISGVALTGVVAGDVLASGAGSVGTFADKNAGAGKNVTGGAIVLTGADAGNYVVDAGSTIGTAAITPKTITATATVTDKVYDGNTTASIGNVAFNGVVAGDALASGAGSVGAFDTKNAGTGKNVTGGGIVLTGADAGNYALDTTAAIGTAAITPRTLTATATVADKVYDGGTSAAISGVAFTGVVAGDVLTSGAGSVGTFADRNVGAGKNVTGGAIVLAGADAGNYVVDAGSTIGTAAITPKALTATASVADKVYDGTTAATLGNVALVGVVAGDQNVVGTTGTSGSFATRNAGTGKVVSGSGVALSGSGASNYTFDTTAQIGTAAITPKTVTATASVADKVYDGGTSATISGVALTGVVAGDVLASGAGSVGTFADKNVGAGKNVTGGAIVLTGADAGNYVVDAGSAIGAASITPKTITATATVADKAYDGNRNAAISNVAFNGVVAGDALASGAASAGTFDTKNAGTGKTVTGGGIVLTGADAGNYVVNANSTIGTGTITPKTITATASVTDKVYDGNRNAAIGNIAFTGVVAGDALASGAGSVGTFADKNVGAGKNVTGGAIVLTGADAGNYVVDAGSAIGTATISPKILTATASVADKVYDGSRTATLGNVAFNGVVAGDALASGAASVGLFNDKNAGTGKTVTGGGIVLTGADAGNYVVNAGSAIGTAAITPKTITATANVADKVYDGGTAATIANVAFNGVVAGDALASGAGSIGTFADKNAGTGKAVTGGAIVLAGADAGNYRVDATRAIGTATISPKLLAASATIGDKVYDGTTTAQITGVTLAGVVAGDIGRVTASGATGRYGDKNVGTGKAVTGSGLGLAGSEAGNYALDTGAVVGTGRITPKTLTASGANVRDKVYDGTAVADVTGLVLGGVVAGDDVAGNGGAGRFASADVGTDKAVTVGALSLAGRDAGNYALDRAVTSGSASIVPLRNDTSAATALIATPVGANGTAVITTRTLEPAPAPTDTTAQASLAVLVTGRATAPTTPQATPAAVAAGAAPALVQSPLVLTDAVLTSQGRTSLALENGVPAAVPLESSVPIYSERASQGAPKSEGRYTVVDRGTDVSLALVANAASLAPPAATSSSGARTTETAVLQADGGALALRVTLLTDGTLTVQVPDASAVLNAETLTAYALATAKDRFGITVQAVKAVIVQYGPLAANMTGGVEKVAGL